MKCHVCMQFGIVPFQLPKYQPFWLLDRLLHVSNTKGAVGYMSAACCRCP